MELKCGKDMVLDTRHTVFGVVSNEFKFFGFCTERALRKVIQERDYQSCSNHMDQAVVKRIKADMKRDCHREEGCEINFQGIMNPADTAMTKYCDDQSFFYI